MNTTSLLTILGMAVATYITRASGFYIASRVNMTPRFKAALTGVPVAIIVSIIAPILIKGEISEYLAALFVALLAFRKAHLLICLGVGIIAINAFRYIFS